MGAGTKTAADRLAERDERLAIEKSKERVAFLLGVFERTTNQLRQENEDILLGAVFSELGLDYVKSELLPEVPVGEVLATPEELEGESGPAA